MVKYPLRPNGPTFASRQRRDLSSISPGELLGYRADRPGVQRTLGWGVRRGLREGKNVGGMYGNEDRRGDETGGATGGAEMSRPENSHRRCHQLNTAEMNAVGEAWKVSGLSWVVV